VPERSPVFFLFLRRECEGEYLVLETKRNKKQNETIQEKRNETKRMEREKRKKTGAMQG